MATPIRTSFPLSEEPDDGFAESFVPEPHAAMLNMITAAKIKITSFFIKAPPSFDIRIY
jgi:hypothetical protein